MVAGRGLATAGAVTPVRPENRRETRCGSGGGGAGFDFMMGTKREGRTFVAQGGHAARRIAPVKAAALQNAEAA